MVTFFGLAIEATFKVRLDQQQGFFEGDVPMNKKLRNGILKAARWTNGVIPYEYGISVGQSYVNMVDAALREIMQNTCIRFVRRTNQPNYVRIINDTGCYSQVGQRGGMQTLSLMESNNRGSCWYHSVILHEFLHAVGLWHEQSRYDRDYYINIDKSSVPGGMQFNFDIVTQQQSNTYNTPYDYYSIMHYGKTAFSQNNRLTIIPKDQRFLDVIGNQQKGSANDWKKVNTIYDCSGATGGGGGVTANKCVDSDSKCAAWAKSGECSRNPGWMNPNCFKSCNPNECNKSTSNCTDSNGSCPGWAQAGECSRNPGYMKANCKKSCNSC
jgi:UDP-N-acetylglucosamine transferase subunit ALG13